MANIKISRFASTNIAAFGITTDAVFHTRIGHGQTFIDICEIETKKMKFDIYIKII